MSDPHQLNDAARHLEAAAQHHLQMRRMHLTSIEHKALPQTHLAHGPKLLSARHHDHAALKHPSFHAEHHPE